ncbi:DUF1697 domain-containing protein [Ottowia sp.]|uniref:DUF1697 domain-containing protein n=1 Tax=Ottowia sp. TaxID=1898956 RepID=UPI0039E34FC6
MNRWVAFLRSVNVGGTGKLPMAELARMCTDLGFEDVQTYIASGNVLFSTGMSLQRARRALEDRLAAYAGKPVKVFLRTPAELKRVLDGNPFADRPAKYAVVIFLEEAPHPDAIQRAKGVADEEMRLGEREIYVFYGEGMGRSKLRIPGAEAGTARNMNTIAKLVDMLADA